MDSCALLGEMPLSRLLMQPLRVLIAELPGDGNFDAWRV